MDQWLLHSVSEYVVQNSDSDCEYHWFGVRLHKQPYAKVESKGKCCSLLLDTCVKWFIVGILHCSYKV